MKTLLLSASFILISILSQQAFSEPGEEKVEHCVTNLKDITGTPYFSATNICERECEAKRKKLKSPGWHCDIMKECSSPQDPGGICTCVCINK